MIKRKQLYRHKPAEGQIGDCHRTAIACLLDMEPADVPHFGISDFDTEGRITKHTQAEETDAWLRERGMQCVHLPYPLPELADVLAWVGGNNTHTYWLLGGFSKTGVNHTVIAQGNCIVWDPSLDDSGIVGPCTDGYFWATFIVPTLLVAA